MRKILFVLSFLPLFLLAFATQAALACCVDNDQDGYGVAYLSECPHPDQFDCDDDASDDPAICATCACGEPDCAPCAKCINPGTTETAYGDPLCGDDIDNDCDGLTDIQDDGCFECTAPEDCDDGNPCTDDLCAENVCTNVNNNNSCDDGDACTVDDVCSNGTCSGAPLDADGDGFPSDLCGGNDCDDSDPAVHPGVTEAAFGDAICADQVDNDCDGLIDLQDNGCQECTVQEDCDDANPCTEDDCVDYGCVYVDNSDLDQDGFPSDLCGGNDCDDTDPAVHPGVFEAPPGDPVCTDGIDNNCNGYTDLEDAGCVPKAGWAAAPPADASVYGAPSRKESNLSNVLFALLLPIGAVALLKRVFRKR